MTDARRGLWLRAAVDGVLAVVLAPACAACRTLLDEPSRGPVCPTCWSAIPFLTPPVCDRCGDPLPSWRQVSVARTRCARCRRQPSPIDRGRALGEYRGSLRDIVHALKYDGRRRVAVPLGRLMARHGAAVLDGADALVPVPLHRRRQRARGFNQAEELARGMGLPVLRALVRLRDTAPQTDLPAARRHRNVKDAFGLAHRLRRRRVGMARGRCLVLVDDVMTTGATLDACARVLKEAGAREVRALTAARVVLPRS